MNDLYYYSNEGGPSKAEWGSDIIVDLLKAYQIEFVAFNPGSTFRAIEESLVNYGGNERPEIIECGHEEISVAIAHGYAKASGRPMAAILHDVVGTLHASMAIYNAFSDQVPVILMSGTGPMDVKQRRPRIDWVHTAQIQGNLVRDYTKWDDQPVNVENVPESFIRAYKVAMTEPKGPVYLCLDVTLQEQRLDEPFTVPDVHMYSPPTKIAADPKAIRKISELLVEAENPVIVTEFLGRSPESVGYLTKLAELVAVPVMDLRGRFNFPNTHPLDLTGTDILKTADLVLALDTPYLYGDLTSTNWITRHSSYIIPESAKVVQIGFGDIGIKSTSINYHKLQYAEINVTADASIALPQLLEACSDVIGRHPERNEMYKDRYERLQELHCATRKKWKMDAKRRWESKPVSLARLAGELWEVIKDEDWVLANGNLRGWARKLWDWTEPHQHLGDSGGSGLGYGLPASVGVALAHRDTGKLCIDVQSDGDMLFTCSAIWTATHHRIPLLVVMNNNQCYGNSAKHREMMDKVRGRGADLIGNTIDDPAVDFAKMAQSYGAHGIGPIEEPDEIRSALMEAIKFVKRNKSLALVDVLTEPV